MCVQACVCIHVSGHECVICILFGCSATIDSLEGNYMQSGRTYAGPVSFIISITCQNTSTLLTFINVYWDENYEHSFVR